MPKSAKNAASVPFLTTFYEMVDNDDDDSIQWSADGKSVVINDIKSFTKVLANSFKQSNYPSFVKKLSS